MDQETRELSDRLVRLIQTLFALVLVQGLWRSGDVVADPLNAANAVALLAMAVVYFTTVRSWIDWHITMGAYPYDIDWRHGHRNAEMVRLWTDFLFVGMYAYLLITIEPLIGNGDADLTRHIAGYPVIFALYYLSAIARRRTYGSGAGQIKAIGLFGTSFLLLAVAYPVIFNLVPWADGSGAAVTNAGTLIVILVAMILYRRYRQVLRLRMENESTPNPA